MGQRLKLGLSVVFIFTVLVVGLYVLNSRLAFKSPDRVIDYSRCVTYRVGCACIGMTTEEVQQVLGTPASTEWVATEAGLRELELYGSKSLYFEHGVLVAFVDEP